MIKRAMLTVIIFILPFALAFQNAAVAAEEVTLNPEDDVSLTNRFPNQTSSSNVILRVSYTTGNQGQYISFFNFDLSEIPTLAKIDSADLVLTQRPDTDNLNVPFTAMLITDNWKQQTITWNTKPDTDGNKFPIAIENFMLGATEYTRFDLTKLVQEWVKNKDTTYGFQLEGPKNMGYVKKYHSSRGDILPRLVVEYSVLAGIVGEHGMIQKEAVLPPDDTGDKVEGAATGTEDVAEEIIVEDTDADPEVNALESNFAEVLTPTNIKIAAGAVFLLILIKILLSKRS